MRKTSLLTVACAALVCGGAAAFAATPQASLNGCQNAVKTAAAKYVSGKVAAIGGCLQAISTQLIKNNADATKAAATCVSQFRLINDSRGFGKSLPEKLAAGISKACLPGPSNPNVTHSLGDILGSGATVSQPIDADNIALWCSHFGGGGTITSLADWINCIQVSQECAVDAAISTQYPRALEWLDAVKPKMGLLTAPGTDPNKITDAVAGLDAVRAAMAGPSAGTTPGMRCGDSCGNGTIELGEQCDQSNLNGQTCTTLGQGFVAGTLRCGPYCTFDTSTCYTNTARFVDNGNGTILDTITGLTWEKKDSSGSIHDQANQYTWTDNTTPTVNPTGTAFTVFLSTLNGGGGFAGHTDWRLPTLEELQGIVDYTDSSSPMVNPAFDTACVASCANTSCSCTAAANHWTGSTVASTPMNAWLVNFSTGEVTNDTKDTLYAVRAVR